MPICRSCNVNIPNGISHCKECGFETGFVTYPDDPNWWNEQEAARLASEAESLELTYQRLATKKSGFFSRIFSSQNLEKHRTAARPIIGYLSPGETPHYLFTGDSSTVVRDREEARFLRNESSKSVYHTGGKYTPLVVVTDKRILSINGNEHIDILTETPFDLIIDIEVSKERKRSYTDQGPRKYYLFKITTIDSKFEFHIAYNHEETEINRAIKLISDVITTINKNRSSLVSEYNQGSKSDEGLGDCRNSSVVNSTELDSVRTSRANINWGEVVRSGFNLGVKSLTLARVAPYSTPVLVGAAALGGAALNAHKQVSGSSKSIDPETLIDRGLAGAEFASGYTITGINEQKFGATVGASRYIAERLTPKDLNHWVVRTNPETIIKGAEAGSRYASTSNSPVSPKQGAIAGACAGLIYSYTPQNSPLPEVDPEKVFDISAGDGFAGSLS